MSDTAIEALRYSEFPNSSDCISRQAAIDALMAEPLKWDDSSVWESARCHQWMMDMDVIKALPSARPEHEYTMEEFMYGQDRGNPEDGSL